MKSIGISIRETKDITGASIGGDGWIQLHINLWKRVPRNPFGKKENGLFYLDIGILTKFSTEGIKIYFPFELSDEKPWIDLGHILIESQEILCTLFNEDYKKKTRISDFTIVEVNNATLKSTPQKTSAEDTCGCICLRNFLEQRLSKKELKTNNKVKIGDTPQKFAIYTLKENDISIQDIREKDEIGSIFNITIPTQSDFNKNEYYYLRFRIGIKNYKGLAYKTSLSNAWLQSAFTNLDMYNIQINQQRDISPDIRFALSSDYFEDAKFSKIHLMYVANPKVSVENGSSIKSDSRLIEPDKWQPYLPENFKLETYVAHHWKPTIKKGNTISNTELFFTAKYPEYNIDKICLYIIGVIAFGCIGSLIASYMCDGTLPTLCNTLGITLVAVLLYFLCYISYHWILPWIFNLV